jgi:hypothetical protein
MPPGGQGGMCSWYGLQIKTGGVFSESNSKNESGWRYSGHVVYIGDRLFLPPGCGLGFVRQRHLFF